MRIDQRNVSYYSTSAYTYKQARHARVVLYNYRSLPSIQLTRALERAEAFLHVDNEAVRGDGDGGADLCQGTRPGGGSIVFTNQPLRRATRRSRVHVGVKINWA